MTDILRCFTLRDILNLDPGAFAERGMTRREFEHVLSLCGAFWMYSGNPRDAHVELTSGLCSDGYINCKIALQYPPICRIMAHQVVLFLRERYAGPIDWAVGSATAALRLAEETADILGCNWGRMEKQWRDGDEVQVWMSHPPSSGDVVLQVEELMTTAITTVRVRTGIQEAAEGISFSYVPYIVVLAHRSSVREVGGDLVLPCFHFDIKTWSPGECPHCKAGSRRVQPKAIWEEFAT